MKTTLTKSTASGYSAGSVELIELLERTGSVELALCSVVGSGIDYSARVVCRSGTVGSSCETGIADTVAGTPGTVADSIFAVVERH